MTKLIPPTQKCYLTVLWGENPIASESEPEVYTFNTVEERDAFVKAYMRQTDGMVLIGRPTKNQKLLTKQNFTIGINIRRENDNG